MLISYNSPDTLKIVKQSDAELFAGIQELINASCLPFYNCSIGLIVGNSVIEINKTDNPNETIDIFKNDRINSISSLNSQVVKYISIIFSKNKAKVLVNRDDTNQLSDAFKIILDNIEVNNEEEILRFIADANSIFRLINIENEKLKVADDNLAKLHQMREADISILRSTLRDMLKQLQSESKTIRKENEDDLRIKRDELEGKYKILEEQLRLEIKQEKEILDANRVELEARIKDVNDKESKFERRAIHEEMKKTIRDRMAKLKITLGTKLLRLPIHGVFVTLIITFSILLYRYSIATLTGQQNTGQQIINTLLIITLTKSLIFGIVLGTTALFYIKWQMAWFKQHADEEFRMKKFDLDIDRANWIVEMLIEWEKENKSPVPDGLINHFTKGMFSDGASTDAIQHPLEEIITSITKSAIKAKVSTPNGVNCEVEKK